MEHHTHKQQINLGKFSHLRNYIFNFNSKLNCYYEQKTQQPSLVKFFKYMIELMTNILNIKEKND
jgi:hypothetical protein